MYKIYPVIEGVFEKQEAWAETPFMDVARVLKDALVDKYEQRRYKGNFVLGFVIRQEEKQ